MEKLFYFLIVIIIVLLAFFLIYVVYPVLAKRLSPNLTKLKGSVNRKGLHTEAEWKVEGLNKLIEVTESESQPSLVDTKEQSSSSSTSSTSTEEYIKQLENKIEILNKLLAGTSTVAVITAAQYILAERVSFLEKIRDQALEDVTTSDADSPIVKSALPLTRECSTCARFKLNNKEDYYGICDKDQDVRQSYWCCDDWTSRPRS